MRKPRRRWWTWVVVAAAVAVAAALAGFFLLEHKASSVRYLTSTATTGTIADTVQADFTLADAAAP